MYKNALKGGIRTAKQAWKFRNGDYPDIFYLTIPLANFGLHNTTHTRRFWSANQLCGPIYTTVGHTALCWFFATRSRQQLPAVFFLNFCFNFI